MTNKDILRIAATQSSYDCNCRPEDFFLTENKVVISKPHELSRKYLELPFYCDIVSYGSNIVASVNEEIADVVSAYINKYSAAHCFETPNFHALNDELQKRGMRICFMAEYFLPDVEAVKPAPCAYETRILRPSDFSELYTPEWGNALSEKRKHLDMLGIGAYDNGKLVGLAACSADCDGMWQIGVDVLLGYRRNGIASALTSALAAEILKLGIVPFYCCAWSNIGSAKNAIKSGFRPAWAEMTAKSAEFVDEMNR